MRPFGEPLVAKKSEGVTTSLRFLGMVIDTDHMECWLPQEKLESLCKVREGSESDQKLKLWDSVPVRQINFFSHCHITLRCFFFFLMQISAGHGRVRAPIFSFPSGRN